MVAGIGEVGDGVIVALGLEVAWIPPQSSPAPPAPGPGPIHRRPSTTPAGQGMPALPPDRGLPVPQPPQRVRAIVYRATPRSIRERPKRQIHPRAPNLRPP